MSVVVLKGCADGKVLVLIWFSFELTLCDELLVLSRFMEVFLLASTVTSIHLFTLLQCPQSPILTRTCCSGPQISYDEYVRILVKLILIPSLIFNPLP